MPCHAMSWWLLRSVGIAINPELTVASEAVGQLGAALCSLMVDSCGLQAFRHPGS